MTYKQILREAAITAVVTTAVFLFISVFIARYRVDGFSMAPTFGEGEEVVVWLTHGSVPARGDVVIFYHALDENLNAKESKLIKRVIGVPGDHININNNQVYVNDSLLSEPYANGYSADDLEGWDVPQGFVLVMGDNRTASVDSRVWGLLPIEKIVGKVVLRYKPLSKIKILSLESGSIELASTEDLCSKNVLFM